MIRLETLRWIRFIPMLALAAGLFATPAKADLYKGQFTLTSPAQWGNLVLQPGTYRISLYSMSSPYTLFVEGKGVRSYITAINGDLAPSPKPASLDAGLKLDEVDGRLVVRKLDLASLGLTLEFAVPKTNRLATSAGVSEGNSACSGKQ